MQLFNETITNWDDWGRTFQSIPAFAPLVEHIFRAEGLPFCQIENMTPGTNAVFKVGAYVVKIFAPPGLGQDFGVDVNVEIFGMKLAEAQGVPAPRLLSDGLVQDKYPFRYMVMDYMPGRLFDDIEGELTYEQKFTIGQKMRAITDKLNVKCEEFTSLDVLEHAINNEDWREEGFPESLLAERLAYLRGLRIPSSKKVYCHGDLHGGNILVDGEMNVYIVDFADAMFAPREYELLYIVSSLFCFQRPYMLGFFGDYAADDIAELCVKWLPIHAWGHNPAAEHLQNPGEITSFDVMRQRLKAAIEAEMV
ncbi:MAG: aminoglycoside phosphotransferase family protein [Defluviitaleaceae bacterium]|nr:aminoglycoside phosphotransferase family protein [Defluviitaleaceae bacterium]